MDEKKVLEKLKKEMEAQVKKNSTKESVFKAMKGYIKSMIDRMVPDMQDPEDIAYVMVMAYLEAHGYQVSGNDVLSGGKKVAEIGPCNYDGINLEAKIKCLEPIHYIMVNITIDEPQEE